MITRLKEFFNGPPLESLPPEQQLAKLQMKKGVWMEEDKTLGIKFFGDKAIQQGKRDTFALYVASDGKAAWPRLVMGFSQNSTTPWVMFHAIKIRVDGELFDITIGKDAKRTTEPLSISTMAERVDVNASGFLPLIRKIAESENVFVRFSGSQYHYEMTVSREQKTSLQEMLKLLDLQASILSS